MHSPGSVAFRIFGLDVMWYGLLIGGGFLLATIISYLRAPKHQIKSDFILDLVIWMIPAAIVGPQILALSQMGSGSYLGAFWVFFAVAIAALAVSFFIKPPKAA